MTTPEGTLEPTMSIVADASLGCRLLVVPVNDHYLYRRATDPGDRRHHSHAFFRLAAEGLVTRPELAGVLGAAARSCQMLILVYPSHSHSRAWAESRSGNEGAGRRLPPGR